MKRYHAWALCISTLISLNVTKSFAAVQSSAAKSAQTQASSQPNQTTKAPLAFGLEDGTPVKIRLQRTISSADAQVDDRVDFDVLEEIKVKDLVVIPKGSVAWGTVTEAQPKRRMGRGGKLNVNIDSVRLADGEKAALRAVKDVKGGGHTGAMTGAMVATGIVFFPAAPFFLFMHGKDITIPKGTEITAYVNGDAPLDPAKFGGSTASQVQVTPAAPAAAAQAVAQPSSPTEPSTVVLKSTPDGADVAVDGKYVGSTPSTLKLAPGDHDGCDAGKESLASIILQSGGALRRT
jgi:PEGA domain-containing protein